jgi:putative polymerase
LIAFAALGWRFGGMQNARKAFFFIAFIVVAFGLFEFLAPKAYAALFNVIDFYAARGVVDAATVQRLENSFFVSGSRDGERMVLPFLGDHRVSSIFLEPVSMGNFGAIAIAFALSIGRRRGAAAWTAGLVGLFAIAVADARFGSIVALLFLAARFLPSGWTRIGLPFLPLIALGVLGAFALTGVGHGDDLPTRLAGSGRTLFDMGPAALFGLADTETITFDAGYAYMLAAFGLPFCVILWLGFVMLPTPTAEAERFKLMLAIYACTLLCVSGTSLFAMKTGALAFFIVGALAAHGYVRVPRLEGAPIQLGVRA